MRPANLIPTPARTSSNSKNPTTPRHYHKKRILTHQSLKETKSLLTTQKQLRSNTSESRYHKKSESCKQSYHFPQNTSRKGQINNIKLASPQGKNNHHARIRYHRSESKEQLQQTEKSPETNPWGGPRIAKGLQSSRSSKQRLREQRRALDKLKELKQSMQKSQDLKAASAIKFKGKTSKKPQQIKLAKRCMPDYLQFIRGEGNYTLGFDFSYLRRLSGHEAGQVVDFGVYRVLESIYLCILDVVRGDSQLPVHSAYNLLKQYSLLYFRLFQKILPEFVIIHHLFKLVQTSILSFLVHTRCCLIFLHEAAVQEQALHPKFRETFEKAFSLIVEVTKQLYEGNFEAQKGGHTVTSTFRFLQTSTKLEKVISDFTTQVQKLHHWLEGNVKVQQMTMHFHPLLKGVVLGDNEIEYLAQAECTLAWQLMGIPPIPYLCPKYLPKPFTLVLSLNHTLTFFDSHSKVVQYRPYLDLFLQRLIVWAHQEKIVADLIIDSIERGSKIFAARLYSEHFSLVDGIMSRDLTRIGRPTETTLLLQAKEPARQVKDKRKLQRGIITLSPFIGDRSDKQLLRVLSRLKWMTEGLPESIIDHVPLHLDTLQNIEQELQQGNTLTLSIH